MAETERHRTVANPGRKNRGRRNMTAKQIRYFGTKAQRARLRAGGAKRSNKGGGSHRHRKNAGSHIVGYTLANSGRKRSSKKMAAKKNRSRKNAGKGHSHHAGYKPRKRNHAKRGTMRANKGRGRYQRNAGTFSGSGIGSIVTNAVFVIAGALGSKLLTQMVLGANNVGLIGYAGNAVVGGLMWFVTEKVMHNRTASAGVIAGTAVQIILRLINDYTPFGQYVSQLGMGDYQAQSFVTPQVLVDPYNSAQIRIPGAWMPPPPPPPTKSVSSSSAAAGVAPAGTGMGDLYGGRSSLY
jgi:hypothetical protein